MTKVIAGIDYSMNCPCLCIHEGSSFLFENCSFYYLIGTKKYVGDFPSSVHGSLFPSYISQEERFSNIADFFIERLNDHACKFIGVEGYAMGARGKVFHIGENTGILKHKLWKNDIKFDVPAPTQIKKFATGKGNSKKEVLYDKFKEETGVDLSSELDYNKDKIVSPIGDIVDSYYICKYMFTNY